MKRHLFLLALLPLGLWALFVLPDLLATNPTFWDWRRATIILSGILALWWMSAGVILATRPSWLEQRFGGLDKLYALHKSIGIGSGILVLTHWMSEWLPKKMAKLGWLEPRARGPKGAEDMWLNLAKDVGEWAGYILLALVVIALTRRIPYRYFRLLHKAFGAVFIAGAFHGLMLMPNNFWQQPLGWLTAMLAFAGLIPALLSLSNRIGQRHQHAAEILAVNQHDGRLLEIVCRPQTSWPGHRAGQFLFANFGQRGEGAHPFTIASAWQPQEGLLTLDIKALGDFTAQLPTRVQPGQQVVLEGPYGRFDFSASNNVDRNKLPEHQIWVAGGIGITPFLARLGELADRADKNVTHADLFYSTPNARNGDFPERLEALCQAAGVRLHRHLSERDGPLSAQKIQAALQAKSTVWFCGPAAWGKSLGKTLMANGLPDSAFHQEAFEFR